MERGINLEYKYCECGCGGRIEKYDKRGRERKYILGHQNKVNRSQEYYLNLLNKKNEKAPYCECGCGEKVLLTMSDILNRKYKYRRFKAGHNGRKVRADINLSDFQKQVILGTLLGDGSLNYPHSRSKYPKLRYTHGINQKQYVEEKAEILKDLKPVVRIVENKGFGKHSVILDTSCISYFKEIYDLLYPKGKVVTKEYLDLINEVGLAFWFMDDGSYRRNQGRLHTEGFSKAENELIADWFLDKWDIEAIVSLDRRKNLYYLRFCKEQFERLVALIYPYVTKSMRYKVGE